MREIMHLSPSTIENMILQLLLKPVQLEQPNSPGNNREIGKTNHRTVPEAAELSLQPSKMDLFVELFNRVIIFPTYLLQHQDCVRIAALVPNGF